LNSLAVNLIIERLQACIPETYSIEGYIKSGGQGHVFRGTFKEQPAAIKAFNPSYGTERIQREIDFLSGANHPNLVRVFNAETIDVPDIDLPVPIVAYEFLHGGDLTSHLQPDSPIIPEEQLLQLGNEMGSAIEYLWSHRKVHRDIKPGNILISQDERFVLVDFGFTKHLDLSTITLPGQAPGTLGYKSPEQGRGRSSLTIKSDIFSLGITIYEVATKVHPFSRNQELIGRMVPNPLNSIRQNLSEPLSTLVSDMLRTVPAQRVRDISAQFEYLIGG